MQFHLFEANPALCPCLTKSAELHPDVDVRIKHACVTDMSGWSRLAVKADSGKSFVTDGEAIAVENLTLDDYVDAHSVPHVDLMKLDVEGYEGGDILRDNDVGGLIVATPFFNALWRLFPKADLLIWSWDSPR